MANIRKGEIDFLESIYHDIKNKSDMQDQAKELATLIENLDMRDIIRNEKTRIAVAERREGNPFYGRSKEEIKRISKRIGGNEK